VSGTHLDATQKSWIPETHNQDTEDDDDDNDGVIGENYAYGKGKEVYYYTLK